MSGKPVKVSQRERVCLEVLAESYHDDSEFCYIAFAHVMPRTGLDRIQVRRSIRALARKGLAEFGKGLWTADGEMFGSGYCCTKAGHDLIGDQETAVVA